MIDVLITGLFRKQKIFEESIKIYKKCNLIDKIYFSTWENHLDNNQRQFLERNNIIIIETKTLEKSGPGNIYSQMKNLEVGLEYCKNTHVLKTRSDILIEYRLLNEILNKKQDKIVDGIFDEKIWTMWFDISTPFYMSDECFYGKKTDLKHLYNNDEPFNDIFDEIWQYQAYNGFGGATHQRRYVYPFKDLFGDWINKDKTLSKKYNKTQILREFENEDFISLISKYYHILNKYFWIYNPFFEIKDHQQFGGRNFWNINYNNFNSNFSSSKMNMRDIILCQDSELFISNIINDNTNSLTRKIKTKINEFNRKK